MKIQAINNQNTNFKAVNKHYYDWAVRERFRNNYGELMRVLRYDVSWGNVPAQDAIDTLNAIKKNLAPKSWHESIQWDIEDIKLLLK